MPLPKTGAPHIWPPKALVHRVGGLAIELDKAEVLLYSVTIGQSGRHGCAAAEGRARCRPDGGTETLTARVVIVPSAKIEGEFADDRPNAAIKIHLGCRAIREIDALARNPNIALPVRVEIVACLEARLGRRLMIGLRNAAEIVIRHYAGSCINVPRRRHGRRRRLKRHVGGHRRGCRRRSHYNAQSNSFSHDNPQSPISVAATFRRIFLNNGGQDEYYCKRCLFGRLYGAINKLSECVAEEAQR
jgi:hypothetical protein